MKKRILPLILICTIVIGMSFTIVANAEEPSCIVRGERVTTIPNSDVTLTLTIENNPGISGAEIIVSFDERLTLVNAVAGDAFSALTYVEPSYYRNPTIFVWDSEKINDDDIKDGVILSLTFHTPSDVEDDFPITISYESGNIFDKDLNPMELTIVNGCISSISYLPGDADGNGRLNTLDITAIRRYISDGRQTDPNGYNVTINENAADVDGNGRINTLDITKIRRYISDGRTTDPNGYNIALVPGQMSCAHNLVATSAKSPTCTEEGNLAYWYCNKCDKYFSDAEAKYETTLNNTILRTVEHTPGQWIVDRDSSCSQVGAKHQICSVCGATIDTDTIPLSDHSYSAEWSYDGYAHWYDPICIHGSEIKNYEEHSFVNQICSVCGYKEMVTVTFVDYNNMIIDEQEIEYGANAIAPASPTRNNYRFTGWSESFNNVTKDLIIKAQYIRQYRVSFVDYNGTLLKQQLVDSGNSAIEPGLELLSPRAGYSFVGWDTQFNNVVSDLTVTAQYTINKYNVTFKMPDGTIIKYVDKYGQTHDTQLVEHGSFAIEPEVQPFFFVWEKNGTKEYKAYGFTNWSCDFSNITSNTEVVANYSSDYNQPIIALKYYDDYGVLSPSLTLCNLSNCKLYAFNFKITYKTDDADGTYGFTIEDVNTNSAANWLFNTDGTQLYNLDVNNKTKEMNFAWSNGNGITFKTYGDFINSIIITTTGGAEAETYESFVIEECSMIVSFNDGVTFQKITPIIIYK